MMPQSAEKILGRWRVVYGDGVKNLRPTRSNAAQVLLAPLA
jgi:hypothetical protein